MEFEKKVEEILEHFGGLIDEDTARLLAEYYFGKISEKKDRGFARTFVKFEGEVVDKKVFREKGYCRIEVDDGKEKRYVYFWDDAYAVALNDIFPGMRVEGLAYRGESGYHVRSPDSIRAFFDERSFLPLSRLKAGMSANVKGRVAIIEGIRETKKGDKIAVFSIADGEAIVPLILWDDKIEHAELMSPGDEVVIINAYITEFDGKLNIHAGRNSYVEVRKLEI